jgi:hypothetical protein
MSDEWPFGYGMCNCGCGQQTDLARRNYEERGWIKGEPLRYINGHNGSLRWTALPEVFWERVDRSDPDGCWPYTGCISGGGYGYIGGAGEQSLAHRIAYILTYGEIPGGLLVRHLCNNRACCNPAHLATGTYRDNSDDKLRAERQARGESQGSAILSEPQVLKIYERCLRGEETKTAIARDYGIGDSTVGDIFFGRTWAWLTGASERLEEEDN